VAGELAHDPEAAGVGDPLDRRADVAQRRARLGGTDADRERGTRAGDQPAGGWVGGADDDGGGRVGVVAVELGGDIDRQQLAVAQEARTGNAVDDLVVGGWPGQAGGSDPGCDAASASRRRRSVRRSSASRRSCAC
jgi:hypothetical protein